MDLYQNIKRRSIKFALPDLIDSAFYHHLFLKLPSEIYNLEAQSHVAVSFKNPMLSTQVGNIGTLFA